MQTLLLLCAAYLIGSVPFAVVVSRAFGMADPRTYGSGNPGATNVLRSGNKLAAALTLLGDAFKGWLAVFLAHLLVPTLGLGPEVVPACALAAFLGHLFPVFLGFRGGKGVATAAGVLIGASGWLGLATLGVWLGVAFGARYSSLAALCAALAAPGLGFLLGLDPYWILAISVMSGLLIWRHSDNIRRLLAGEESRIGSKKKA
ncbi:MAG TPA: glycerol-3-phosphate 1-O-acyltransferase PlsY [Zoogloea sp.]|uniref:glycerol-3-phosphate 1-O-acyltransferase PlsY n=1 Tax=Zoogloea sp. TaxID=49181 RepID=UPI002B917AF9|nr:glycerol-3-phosphate 1-O-acyltransferase PlsY [Zoogloea sp.]HMV16905.1 glycerol-3-phosphate 1-O-acyltransferase PlsY [Rhodocyclaceae bacterium]HMV61853.1 glycerol-3-phosphate 1-O-acyltransferase PlsY [Rhodocyclaceae bacterium]HMW53529.1 glycerol-3-phosphate 1-O-acyltransferase PlsY [Rhodocyclaceae bacterium]HMY50229.1 glycerol-3-phosphate 1-O-acyltransferase PlsY [Rhodocyclaceae bacterium]HNB63638.1 glycerol-3-phosphate 1-O-acyltransferase PlsY [Rhodocyclaceae bacterium]